jgi:RNA polymerase sigma factor (sigma-70 family)
MAMGQPPGGGDPGWAARAEEQVTQLFRDHYSHFYSLLRKKGLNAADSRDILNNSGAALYKRLAERGPIQGNVVAYFTRVVQHETAQYRRDRLREPADLVSDEILAALSADLTPAPPKTAASLPLEQRARLEAALSALDDLPVYLREPYELEVYGGLKPVEIARLLGKPPETIRAYLSVARATIRERVAELLGAGVGGREEDDE